MISLPPGIQSAPLLIDGYKLDHRRQYPPNTQAVYSNWTPRRSRIPQAQRIVLFGLQYFIARYLHETWGRSFFRRPLADVVASYTRAVNRYLGPNTIDTSHIEHLHELGYLPLDIRAIPEGLSVPVGVPMLTIENTHRSFAWLVNYLETLMSCAIWQPCTTATTARAMRHTLDQWARVTGGDPSFVDWQGHDFSFRGMGGPEAAAISGAAHLLYFTGTDTIPAIEMIERYYPEPTPAEQDAFFIGGSVAATEHSVMSAGGSDLESELATYSRLLDLYPTGVVSVVSDTWDLWRVIREILPRLKDKIMARDGKLVIRPDSGDPELILAGDPLAPFGTPQHNGVIAELWNLFGGSVTATGHRLLDPHIGAIYGDSINLDRADAICQRLHRNSFASTNVVLGIGSYTYQYVTRDTYGFAMKATWAMIDGKDVDLYKDPVTDDGTKKSARGRLAVLRHPDTDDFYLVDRASPEEEAASVLQPVWCDGRFDRVVPFSEIRDRARRDLSRYGG